MCIVVFIFVFFAFDVTYPRVRGASKRDIGNNPVTDMAAG